MIYQLPVVYGTKQIPAGVQSYLQDETTKFLVAFSGGKDSVAMVLYLHFRLGIPWGRITLHHHDVDGGADNLFDWPCTPSYCEAFAEAFGVELLVSYAEGGIDREMHRKDEGKQDVLMQETAGGVFRRLKANPGNSTKMMFPAVSGDLRYRWCSAVAKIDVFGRVATNHPDYKAGRFVLCTGERRQESAKRSSYKEWEPMKAKTKKRDIIQWRPIIDWTEEDVWQIIEEHNVQPHPCYMLGWSRCSCQICIFGGNDVWASIMEIAEHKVYEIALREERFNFTLYKDADIITKASTGKSFIVPENRQRWATEAMSTFSSPVILDEWQLPQGAYSRMEMGSV